MLVLIVDDTFVVCPRGHSTLDSFFNHLHNISAHIQFTMEIQNENSLPFLDVLISHQSDGTLTHQVYRKKSQAYHYLHVQSQHHPTQKCIVLKNLIAHAIRNFAPQFLEKE
jgi:hypothetical protein